MAKRKEQAAPEALPLRNRIIDYGVKPADQFLVFFAQTR